MGKKKANPSQLNVADRSTYQQSVENNAQVSNTYENTESVPRQRGRPRKIPLEDTANVREDSVGSIVSKALHIIKTHNKPIVTHKNGFSRNIKADAIMGGFLHDGELIFGVRFKGRKLPQFIEAHELKVRAPILMIQYYLANLEHT